METLIYMAELFVYIPDEISEVINWELGDLNH